MDIGPSIARPTVDARPTTVGPGHPQSAWVHSWPRTYATICGLLLTGKSRIIPLPIANSLDSHAHNASIGLKESPKGIQSPSPSAFRAAAFLPTSRSACTSGPPAHIRLPIADYLGSHASNVTLQAGRTLQRVFLRYNRP